MKIVIYKIRSLLIKKNGRTLLGCGGAGVIVTDGDKSLTPGGKLDGGLPKELLWGGCGTDKLARLLNGDGVIC